MDAVAAIAVIPMTDFTLQYHITDYCTQHCSHCYLEDFNSTHVSIDEMNDTTDKFIQFLDRLNTMSNVQFEPVIHFTGGDPVLNIDLNEAVHYASNLGVKVGIIGNPDHLSQDYIKDLKSSGCRSFQITLDGTKSYHDMSRNMNGLFDYSIDMINLLADNGIKPFVLCNVSNENIDQLLPLYYHLSDSSKLFGFAVSRIVKYDHIDVDVDIDPRKYMHNLQELLAISKKSKVKLLLKDPLFSSLVSNMSGGCQAGISLMCKMHNADVYACKRLNIVIGNHRLNDFYDIYVNSQLMRDLRDFSKYECNTCSLVSKCRGCPAVSYGLTGDIFKKDPHCVK